MARASFVMMAALHLTAAAPSAADIDPSDWKCKPGDVTVETMRDVNGRGVEILTRGPGCPDAGPAPPSPPARDSGPAAASSPGLRAHTVEEAAPSIVVDGLHAHAGAASVAGAGDPVAATGPSRAWLFLAPLLVLGLVAASAAVCFDRRVRRPRLAALEAGRRRKEAEEQAEALRLAEEGRAREALEQERRSSLRAAAEREEAARALREVREAAEREAAREREETDRRQAEALRQRDAAGALAREEGERLDRERRAAEEEEAQARRRAQEEAEAKAKKRCGPCGGCGSKPQAGQPAPAAPASGR